MPLEGIPSGYSLASPAFIRLANILLAMPERIILWPWFRNIAIDRPIFIIGAYRSGTTLIEQILAQHSQTGHFWFITNICRHFPITGYWIARLLQSFGFLGQKSIPFIHNPRLNFNMFSPYECELIWIDTPDNQWNEHCQNIQLSREYSDARFERYLFSLIKRHLLIQSCSRFINKNPVNCLRIGYLLNLFPDAQFIYMIRNPLDSILSHYRTAKRVEQVVHSNPKAKRIFVDELRMTMLSERLRTKSFTQTVELEEIHPLLGIANQWKDLNLAVLKTIADSPGFVDQVLFIRYEQLVTDPEKILTKLWAFTDLCDQESEELTQSYLCRISPTPQHKLEKDEIHLLPHLIEILAPVASRLRYPILDDQTAANSSFAH